MKKTLAVGTAFILSFSAVSIADDFSGHRVGIGFISTDIENSQGERVDWGSGVKIEYGYDINRIFGVNLSYSNTSDSVQYSYNSQRYGSDLSTSTFKFDTDIGYTFQHDNFAIKPYGALGVASYKDKLDIHLGDANSTSLSYSDSAPYFGIGVRGSLDHGIYADLRLDYLLDDVYTDQFSLSVGYKF
ncbi:porin family protein [Enterovibrio norvegicus]|uniref:porin family protein n=1 Tax=Enterovibrio norvegicus TaxID=188144 RepID=UPI0024B1CCB1|nr:porin family protein [Enterovibrio norvegicus]